jgi:hypothetical protein
LIGPFGDPQFGEPAVADDPEIHAAWPDIPATPLLFPNLP